MIELWNAIDNFFLNDAKAATWKALMLGGLHNLVAPPNVTFPFGTFQLISGVADHFASGNNFTENCLVQFNLFSKESSMKELINIYDALIGCFDFVSLTIDSYTFLSCIRQNTIQTRVEGIWQINVTYRILLEP